MLPLTQMRKGPLEKTQPGMGIQLLPQTHQESRCTWKETESQFRYYSSTEQLETSPNIGDEQERPNSNGGWGSPDDKGSKSPGEKQRTPTLTLKSSNGSEIREQLCVYLCIYFIYHPVELKIFLSKYLEFCHSIVLLFSGYAMKRKFPNGSFASPQVLTPNSMLSFYHSNSNA